MQVEAGNRIMLPLYSAIAFAITSISILTETSSGYADGIQQWLCRRDSIVVMPTGLGSVDYHICSIDPCMPDAW